MARILLVWELGAGLGHLGRLAPVAAELVRRGHEVSAAFRNPPPEGMFARVEWELTPKPQSTLGPLIAEPGTFADLLYNAGCSSPESLAAISDQWRDLFGRRAPDLLVLDFAPIALLASQGLSIANVQFGNGFAVPRDETPLPDLCPWTKSYEALRRRTEAQVLALLNGELLRQHQPSLDRVAQLTQRSDLTLLTTYADLDHYGRRDGVEYVGACSGVSGIAPEWPDGAQRVFGYLTNAAQLRATVASLVRRGASGLIYYRGPETGIARQVGGVRIGDQPFEVRRVAAERDAALCHAGSLVYEVLLAGKPLVLMPLQGEQRMLTHRVATLGAGVGVETDTQSAIDEAIGRVLDEPAYTRAAEAFRERYRGEDPQQRLRDAVDRIEGLLR